MYVGHQSKNCVCVQLLSEFDYQDWFEAVKDG